MPARDPNSSTPYVQMLLQANFFMPMMTVGDIQRQYMNMLPDSDFFEAFPCSHERGLLAFMHITPLAELAKQENSLTLSNYRDTHNDPSKWADKNKELVMESKNYVANLDNKMDVIHPRMFDIVSLAPPGKLFQSMKQHYKGKEIPVNCYNLEDFQYRHNISPQTWIDLHDPECGTLSVAHFLPSSAIDDKGFPSHKQQRKCLSMSMFFRAWQLLKRLKRTICALDFSYDLIDSFLAEYEYFLEDSNIEPMKPWNFCILFVDECIKENANQYKAGKECILFVEMEKRRESCYKIVAASRPAKSATTTQPVTTQPTTDSKKANNKRPASNNNSKSNAPKNAVKGYCWFFNENNDCRSKAASGGCVSRNTYYRHKCHVSIGGDKYCDGDHPACKHKEATESKRRR